MTWFEEKMEEMKAKWIEEEKRMRELIIWGS